MLSNGLHIIWYARLNSVYSGRIQWEFASGSCGIGVALSTCVFTTCVFPVLLYGSGAWTLRADDTRKLQAFSLRCQRRILGVRWSDSITNATISEAMSDGPQKIHMPMWPSG